MLINLGISIFGILIFLFIFWKRLRDDYAAEIVFQSATYILIGIGLGYIISARFFPVWFFWTAIVGGLIGLIFALLNLKVRFYESLEAFIIASLPWLALVFLNDSVRNSSLISFFGFLGILLIVFVSYYIDMHYKGFSWYKSGKIGFAGLSTAALVFLIRSALATAHITMLSFVGRGEAIVSGVAVFTCFLLLFNLGRIKE